MGRFTSHGEVCYEPTSKGRLVHPFWGDYRQYWPGQATPDTNQPAAKKGCGECNKQAPQVASLDEWVQLAGSTPSDFHEHVATLRDLAAGAEVVVELSHWLKPSCVALAAGRPKVMRSYCPGPKPEWPRLKELLGEAIDFAGVQADSLAAEPIASDVLFIDTLHRADRLYAELQRWAPLCRHYLVVHCTVTFGEKGDDGNAGVLPALRRYLKENPEWSVKAHHRNNHGLIVLTRDPAEKKQLPPAWKQGWNFLKASARHAADGFGDLEDERYQQRVEICTLCESRNGERCGECGCPILKKASWKSENCPIGKWHQEEASA